MKFLCICEGGNVRSVSLAFLLKSAGQDALAASARFTSPATLAMLWDWAEHVIVMSPEIVAMIPAAVLQGRRLAVVDVGPDRFGSAFHPELIGMLQPVVEDWLVRGWEL